MGEKSKLSWKHASEQTRNAYMVFGKSFWHVPESSDSRKKARQYHKARAKLIFGNLLTLGLVNIGLMVGIKRANERKHMWESFYRNKVETFAKLNAQNYQLVEDDFIRYMRYKIIGGEKPSVRPSTNPAFANGWGRFVNDHRDELEEAGIDWWE